uniref:Ig-like domain-containing protein n=1 Tax=Macrostomum lignano TaxID=282301 RepID=A0A1I8FAE3_9PLAT
MAARLEVDLKSHMFQPASPRAGPVSPIPFPPCFSGDISEDLEAQVDDKVTIACIVHGHPKPEVAWHKDGVLLLQNSHGIELWSQGFEHRLVIPYVGHEHAGVYCIAAANSLGQAECHCVISVIDEPADSGVEMLAASAASLDTPAARGCCTADCLVPPELLSLFRDRYCRAGEPVTLECEVAASPAPKVAWSFNGQPSIPLTGGSPSAAEAVCTASGWPEPPPPSPGASAWPPRTTPVRPPARALLIVEDPDSGRLQPESHSSVHQAVQPEAEKPSLLDTTVGGRSVLMALRVTPNRLPPDGAATGLSCICGFGFACSEGFFCSDDLEPPSPLNSRSSKPWNLLNRALEPVQPLVHHQAQLLTGELQRHPLANPALTLLGQGLLQALRPDSPLRRFALQSARLWRELLQPHFGHLSGQFGRSFRWRSTRRSCSASRTCSSARSASNGPPVESPAPPTAAEAPDFAAPVNRWNIRGTPEPDDDTRDSSCRFSLLSRLTSSECFCRCSAS